MNIAKILKDCPSGTRLYSPIFGELSLVNVNTKMNYHILCSIGNGNTVTYTKDGKNYIKDAEPTLFFSKEKRDWSEFNIPLKNKESGYQFKPFEKVLVRDFDNLTWNANFYSYYASVQDGFNHVCVAGAYKQCIPYKGNEHLLGTNNKPENN